MAMVRKRRYSGDSNEGSANASLPGFDFQEPYIYTDRTRDTVCLSGFRELRESESLFDVTIKVDDRPFRCHRAFLASSSDYFLAMFTNNMAERDQDVIQISGVDAISMDLVITFMYTGNVQLHTNTVQNLLSAANLFQLRSLRDGCAHYMAKKIDVENCIGIHFFAQAHECEFLEFQAWDWITENFEAVSESAEFLDLNSNSLIEIIKYDDIQATEEEVYEAAVRWLEHKPEDRTPHIYDIFSHIRFSLVDRHYLFDRVKSNPHLTSDPKLEAMFDEVIKYKLLKSRWLESDMRLEPRYGSDFCRVIVYSSYLDDDKKQVLQIYGQRSDEVATRHGNILCDVPTDMENPALLVTGLNDLYIAGGEWCSKNLYKYCSDDGTFEKLTEMPIGRKQFGFLQVDDHLYTIGGCNTTGNLSSCLKYSDYNDEWFPMASLPKALRCLCAVAFQGKLYVFGGECEKMNSKKVRGKTELSKQAFCYDPRLDKWNVLADMSTPRALAGCTVYKNKIYVIGGFATITESWVKDKSPENCLNSVEIYDPCTNSWEAGPELPRAVCAMGVVKYYGTIYIIGGENDEDLMFDVYYLSEEDKWEHKDEMVTGITETTIHSYFAVMDIAMDDRGSASIT